ncbi:hypothetical protein N0V84_005565 [Fusarium piperis]|uniref:Uncharacterized protein n=1 Tax=Fusarium piperis TaxID=1435070 RepID=A0A9W8WDP2_9HYPO|nr:hypothetical protein N0V84_005565 [Fusarium piperis]
MATNNTSYFNFGSGSGRGGKSEGVIMADFAGKCRFAILGGTNPPQTYAAPVSVNPPPAPVSVPVLVATPAVAPEAEDQVVLEASKAFDGWGDVERE